jgi:hypothetical protein
LLGLFLLGGCSDDTFEGTKTRQFDATYSRSVLKIKNQNDEGFSFDFTVYNGDVAGRLSGTAAFSNDAKNKAKFYCGENGEQYLEFSLGDDGAVDVFFYGGDLREAADSGKSGETAEGYQHGISEQEVFGFAGGSYVSGRYLAGEPEYLNSDLWRQGIIGEKYDLQLQGLLPKDMYIRLLDCFMHYKIDYDDYGDPLHQDEIGGFLYYGYNDMSDWTAVIICYDDGSVSAIVSKEDGSLNYYTNNHVYTNKKDPPYPLVNWVSGHNAYIIKREEDRLIAEQEEARKNQQ